MLKKTYHCRQCGNNFDKIVVENVVKSIMPQCPYCGSDAVETMNITIQKKKNLQKKE